MPHCMLLRLAIYIVVVWCLQHVECKISQGVACTGHELRVAIEIRRRIHSAALPHLAECVALC